MPFMCFSYPADVPSGTRNCIAAQAALRDQRRMPYPCFSYPAMCLSYPSEVLLGVRNRGAVPPASPGLRRMPDSICFRY